MSLSYCCRVLGVLVWSVVAMPLNAQDTTARDIRQTAATFMHGQLRQLAGYRSVTPRVFVADILPVQAIGAAVRKTAPLGALSADEARDLAARMGADGVVAPADTIGCRLQDGVRQCSGTTGFEIRLGAPVVVGDSAVVVYSLLQGSSHTTGPRLPSRVNRFALILTRRDGAWKVTAYYLANQDLLQSAMAWDSVSIPGTGTRGGAIRH